MEGAGDVLTREQRFWKKVEKTDHCWLWVGAISDTGYGNFSWDMRPILRAMGAHRASWLIHFGEIPGRLCVLHACDNRRCVRPDHLWLGTHLDNYADMRAKGRERKSTARKTHCKHGHEFTPENTSIHQGKQRCLTCHRLDAKRRREVKKAASC